jgi:hypothetical protein
MREDQFPFMISGAFICRLCEDAHTVHNSVLFQPRRFRARENGKCRVYFVDRQIRGATSRR